ncbi:hypothetical protein ACI65C_013451 [Semiaphis heraclei]
MLDMGKRRKVQCESCGSIFNNDFQKKRENALHGGKRVKIKVPGAPANPFVASMSSNMKSNLLENVNSELANTTNVLVDKNDVSTVASINVNDVSHDISNGQHINLLENVNLKYLPSTTSESENSKTNDLTNSVLNCAGQFRYLFDYIKLCKPIIHNFQETEVLNAYKIVVEIKEAIDNIIKISNSVLEKCYDVTTQLESQSGNASEVEVIDSVKRKLIKKTKNTAFSLSKKLISVDFVVSLMFMKNIMYKLKLLTECLESVELNITDATLFISSTLKSLDIINSDSGNMDNLIQSAVVFLKKYEVDAEKEFSVRHRRRIAPKNVDSNRSNASEFSFHSEKRNRNRNRKEFKMVLDKLNGLIKDHLEKSINDIKPLYIMFKPPFSKELLTETLIQDAIQFLPNNVEIDPLTVQCELEVLYDQCQNKSTMSDLAKVSHELKTALPLANLLCRLSCTAPVTVAGNERSFSKLKIVKNYLRTTQEDSRLNNLMLLSSEKDLVDKISLNEMAQKWATLKKKKNTDK